MGPGERAHVKRKGTLGAWLAAVTSRQDVERVRDEALNTFGVEEDHSQLTWLDRVV